MPVVFSPGEPETRPLNPDEIVYTTAQKVADILGVGPGEAVLLEILYLSTVMLTHWVWNVQLQR